MESPRPTKDSKQVHWMGRPSEEQLLGPLHRPLREGNVSFEPPPPPEWGLTETHLAEGDGAARRWRIGPRDLFALAAVAALVWLAVRSGDGLPFRTSEPAAPAAASSEVKTALGPDRADWKRTSPSTDGNVPGSKSDGGRKAKNGSSGPGGKDGKDGKDGEDNDPPTGGGGGDETKPLLEATIPGVGTVTVDEPELPTVPDVDGPTLPDVPDVGDVLSEAPTVPLP
jgi:hypothetical protein